MAKRENRYVLDWTGSLPSSCLSGTSECDLIWECHYYLRRDEIPKYCPCKERRGYSAPETQTHQGEGHAKMEAEARTMRPQAKGHEDFRNQRTLEERQGTDSPPGEFPQEPPLLMLWFWTYGLLTVREWVSVVWGHPVGGTLSGKPQDTDVGCAYVTMLTYTAWVHGERGHLSHVDSLDVFNQQTKQRQVESGYPCLMALKRRHMAHV